MAEQATSAPTETAKAASAFAAYIRMGPGRSLRALAHALVEQNQYKTSTTALGILNNWSTKYRWQERIAAAVTEKSERMLAQASEIDAATFLRSSELLHERLGLTLALDTDHVVKVRESVRKPAPKGGAAGVNVQVSVVLRNLAERAAAQYGLDPGQVVAEAERILAEVRD